MREKIDDFIVKWTMPFLWGCLLMTALSIPIALGVGKFQVCKIYFPEINRYACLFTTLPPIVRKDVQ